LNNTTKYRTISRENSMHIWRKLLCLVPKLPGKFVVSVNECQASFLFH